MGGCWAGCILHRYYRPRERKGVKQSQLWYSQGHASGLWRNCEDEVGHQPLRSPEKRSLPSHTLEGSDGVKGMERGILFFLLMVESEETRERTKDRHGKGPVVSSPGLYWEFLDTKSPFPHLVLQRFFSLGLGNTKCGCSAWRASLV